jgi:hypothetical protein
MTHTKHPWQYGTENEGYFIANGELRPDIAKQIQSEADASLIAAAPDLLEAVQSFLNWSDSVYYGEDTSRELENAKDKARAAINKAIGEQA